MIKHLIIRNKEQTLAAVPCQWQRVRRLDWIRRSTLMSAESALPLDIWPRELFASSLDDSLTVEGIAPCLAASTRLFFCPILFRFDFSFRSRSSRVKGSSPGYISEQGQLWCNELLCSMTGQHFWKLRDTANCENAPVTLVSRWYQGWHSNMVTLAW